MANNEWLDDKNFEPEEETQEVEGSEEHEEKL